MEMSHWENSVTEEVCFSQIHYLTSRTSTTRCVVFHILPLKQTEETSSGTLPVYRYNQDKNILGSGPIGTILYGSTERK
jgi:hypothetical protein